MRLRQAAAIPSRIPNTPDSTAEMPTSAIVGPALRLISSQTGWLLVYERPKLSVAVCLRYDTNWAPVDLSRPNCFVSSALCEALRFRPRYRFATGSDSTTRNRKKLKQMTNMSVASDARTLPVTKRALTPVRQRCGAA